MSRSSDQGQGHRSKHGMSVTTVQTDSADAMTFDRRLFSGVSNSNSQAISTVLNPW